MRILKKGNTFADLITPMTYLQIWESEFSKLVTKHYNKPYNFQQGRMLNNDSYLTVEVGPEMDLGGWDEDQAREMLATWLATEAPSIKRDDEWREEMWHHRENYISLQIILWDLHLKNLIPAGNYLLEICW